MFGQEKEEEVWYRIWFTDEESAWVFLFLFLKWLFLGLRPKMGGVVFPEREGHSGWWCNGSQCVAQEKYSELCGLIFAYENSCSPTKSRCRFGQTAMSACWSRLLFSSLNKYFDLKYFLVNFFVFFFLWQLKEQPWQQKWDLEMLYELRLSLQKDPYVTAECVLKLGT